MLGNNSSETIRPPLQFKQLRIKTQQPRIRKALKYLRHGHVLHLSFKVSKVPSVFPSVLSNLAVMHFEKFLNPGKAAELLRRCTKSGHAPSLFLLGKMHESGDVGGGKDPIKAALYYRVALAKAGDDDNLRRKVQRRLAGLGEVANRPLVPWPTNV
jgi:TPR repeat protein